MKKSVILIILALCLAVTACAETPAAGTVLGEVKDGVYENEYFGVVLNLEGWHYYTEEEIATINQLTKELGDENLQKLMEEGMQATLMIANDPGNSLNVNFAALNLKDNIAVFRTVGMDTVLQASIPTYQQQLEQTGATDLQLRVDHVSVGEETVTCLAGDYKLLGSHLYMKQLWLLRGDYVVMLTITGSDEAAIDSVLPLISLIPAEADAAA